MSTGLGACISSTLAIVGALLGAALGWYGSRKNEQDRRKHESEVRGLAARRQAIEKALDWVDKAWRLAFDFIDLGDKYYKGEVALEEVLTKVPEAGIVELKWHNITSAQIAYLPVGTIERGSKAMDTMLEVHRQLTGKSKPKDVMVVFSLQFAEMIYTVITALGSLRIDLGKAQRETFE